MSLYLVVLTFETPMYALNIDQVAVTQSKIF